MAKKTQKTFTQKQLTDVVYAFCRERWQRGGEKDRFHMDTLRKHVERKLGKTAPDSAGRTLRQLRLVGQVDYFVADRARSLYELTNV